MSQLVDVGGEQHEFPDEATPEQITTALRGYGAGGSSTLTPEQSSALSGIDMTPFHTDQSQSDDALTQQFREKNNIPTAWEAAKSPMPYVGPAIVNAAAKAAPTLLRLGDVSGLSGIYRGLYGDQAADQVSSGIGRGVGNIAAGFTSPLGVGAMALGGAPSIVQKAASGLFTADMARNIPQNFQAIGDAQTPGDRAQAITEALGTGAMLFGAGSHAFGRPGLVSPDDIAARSLLNRQSAPIAPPVTPDISAPSAGADPRSLFPSSVETAATPAQPPSTTEPSVAPESAGTSNVGAPIEKNISDMLMMSGGDHEAAATMAEKYGMPDVANQIRARAPLPSAVEPMPLLRQGPVPIAGDEGTLAEGAPAPAQPQSVDSVLSQFHMEQDPIKKQALWQQAKGMMESGLPMGPGAMNSAEMPAPDTTSLKRAVVDTERENRGEPEIPTAPVVGDQQAVDNAKSMLDKDPTAGQSVVARINGGDPRISKQDAGLLLAERNRIVQQRTQWEERAAQSTDPTERATADQQLKAIEEQLTAVDNASRTAGSEWSGVGHMYQRNIAEDYSLPALERKARAAKAIATGDGSLSTDELSTVQQQASDYQKLQTEAAEKQQALESAQKEQQAQADTIRAHEQTIKEMQQAEAARPKFGKAVFDQAQKIVDRLKVNADASRIKLRQALSQMNAGVDPTVIVHAANILAHKVGELGLKKAEAFAQMVDEFGDKITPHLEKAWKAAKKLIGAEAAPDEVKKAVKSGVTKGKEKTPEDAAARLKADATAGDPLSHKAVYDVWRSKVKAGVTDVDEAAKATHETVKQSYPEATEQQVREAFSEYGKVKFPSKEADKVTLAEHRRITQLQLSIDRLKQGLDPLHTGLQRDKATQAIREKQAELNELLKQKTGPPSPEALAGRNEARKTALRNSIADLDKQLRTGEKPIDTSTPLPYDPEVERLTAERDAMKDKLNEIEAEENPPPTEAETYNKNRMAQIERESKKAQARIDTGDYGPRPPKPPKELFAATADAHAKLQALRDKIKRGQQHWKVANRTPSQKRLDVIKTLFHVPRNLAIFGHGTVGMFTHAGANMFRLTRSPMFWKNFGEQFKLLSSEQHFNEKVHELKTSPNYNAWRDAGANIDPDSHASDYGSMADEMTKLFESHAVTRPLVTLQKAGNRGFFALKMYRLAMNEADLAEAPDDLKSDPATKKELMRQIADTNNKATGTLTKGNDWLNQGARWAPIREGLFAPKLLFSKIARTVLDPFKTAGTLYDWSKGKASEVDKYMAIKRMKNAGWMVGTALGGLLTNQAILSATGSNQQVNFDDPTKSDWLAFKMGGKVISPYGGLLDILRFVGHLVHDFGGALSPRQARDGRGAAALDTTGRFLRSKLTPTLGIVADTATGYDLASRPVPQRNERQKYADAPRYTWLEYALNKGPIPISQGVKSFYDELRKTGLSHVEALSLLDAAGSAAGSMALGATGIHAGEDYEAAKQQPRSLLQRSTPPPNTNRLLQTNP